MTTIEDTKTTSTRTTPGRSPSPRASEARGEPHPGERELDRLWWISKLTFGIVPIVAGLDKFTHLLVDWTQYLSPAMTRILPVSGATFMHVVGVVEIVAGALVLSRATRLGAYVVSVWLVAIAVSLLASGHYLDVAVRDVVMAVGAFTLARLTEVRARASDEAPSQVRRSVLRPPAMATE